MQKDRIDLRQLPFITIDGSETKDIDDAVYVKRNSNNTYTLYVAIADVSHFVKPGSQLDLDAKKQTATHYLLGNTKHMFPDTLSQGKCSLFSDSDKLVAVCEILYDMSGKRLSYKFYKGIIHSKGEVNYDRVNDLLRNKINYSDEELKYELDKALNDASSLSYILRQNRMATMQNKAHFGMQPKYVLSEDKTRIIDIVPNHRDVAEKMIEEFMIAANLCAGDCIYNKTKNGIVRKHKALTDANYNSIIEKAYNRYEIAVNTGDIFNDFSNFELSTQKQLRNILIEEYIHADYTTDMKNNFHAGLTVKNYSHFTSPIRRYADILAHRLIFDEISSLENEMIEIKEEVKAKDSEEVKEVIKTMNITEWISKESIRIKKAEKAHLRKMLDAYYLDFCIDKVRKAKVTSNFYKTKVFFNKELQIEEKKEVYAGSFVQFEKGDETLVRLPKHLQEIDKEVYLIYTVDDFLTKKLRKTIYSWQLNKKRR